MGGQGNAGSSVGGTAANWGQPGGGGAGSAGFDGTNSVGGNGGTGIYNTLTNLASAGQRSGSNYYVAGGGAGGATGGSNGGTGGLGGGGAGNVSRSNGTSGTTNTGGGGGGGSVPLTGVLYGGNGGSGVAILASSYVAAVSSLSGSPTITKSNNNYIYTFNNNGYLTYTNNTFLNYAASFNGSSQYLSMPSSSAFNITGDFTAEAWIYNTNVGNGGHIFSIGTNSNQNGYAALRLSFYTQLQVIISTTGTTWALNGGFGPNLSNNTWYHVAVVRIGTAVTLYVNGTGYSVGTLSGSLYAGTVNWIGACYYSGGTGGIFQPFAGYISNARIINGTGIYTSNFTVPSSPLTAISGTQLLTCNAATLVDGSSNAFTITNNGTVTTTSSTVPSFAGYSNSFNGSNQYLNLTGQNLSTGSFTIEAWVYLTATGTAGHIFNFGTDTNNRYLVYISPTNKFNIGTVNGGTYTLNDSTVTPSVSTWYHVAFVRNSGTSYLYVNGNQVGSNSTSINSGTNWAIGFMQFGSASADHWNGYISNFRVTNIAVYTGNFTPPTSHLTTTQSAGTNISAITGTQTQLLTLQNSTIVDNSSNNYTITNNNSVTTTSSTVPFAN